MGNTQRASSTCNVKIGCFRDVTGSFKDELGANLVVFEIDGNDRFPRFYYDFGGHRIQINEWLDKIEASIQNSMYPLPPLAVIDPPKAGKSAFLLHLLPHVVMSRYPTAKILHIDFMKMPLNIIDNATDEMRPFAKILLDTLEEGCKKIGLDFRFTIDNIAAADAGNTIVSAFKFIDTECNRRGILCFMLWDEVQRWFQLRNIHAAAIFDSITLHQSFKNLAFAVTGSGMVQIFNAILEFPSNGTQWTAEANMISSSPGAVSLTAHGDYLTIKDVVDDDRVAKNMVTLLQHYHKDMLPTRLLEFVPDKSPAVLGYFCEVHRGKGPKRDETREMRQTLGKCYDKLFQDFKKDCLPLLKSITSRDAVFFDKLIRIASSTMLLEELNDDMDSLQQWRPFFETLLRCKTVCNEKFVCFSGYYGYFIIRSVEANGNSFKLKTLQSFNKLPVPSLWATVALVHELISTFSVKSRGEAEDASLKSFRICGEEVLCLLLSLKC